MRKNEREMLCQKCLKKLREVEAENMRKYRRKISEELKGYREKKK